MGLLDKIVRPVKALFARPTEQTSAGYRTFTEYSPAFSSWDGSLYQQLQTRAIVDRIATACSKLKPEFVTPDGSEGSVPRVQRLFGAFPNDMQTWPDLLRVTSARLFVDNVAYVVPGYDEYRNIVALHSLKPSYAEVVEYEGEPWMRFTLSTGDRQAFPFYDVAILTRFQLDSDVFGSDNAPLTPTLRLMDAQRQAEEIALKTGADIRFIGKMTTNMHEDDMESYRNRFGEKNFSPSNKSRLILYDTRMDDLKQVDPQHYTVPTEEMERIDKALYAYFGINEAILTNGYTPDQWAAFYEGCIEPFALMLGESLTQLLLTPTQVRKGNRIMFSSSYLEYASVDSKIKVANLLTTTGTGTKNEVRDIFQLPRLPNGDVFMVRGEIYITDEDNNVIAESGGHTDRDTSWHDDLSDLDEPEPDEVDDLTRAFGEKVAEIVRRRLEGVEI